MDSLHDEAQLRYLCHLCLTVYDSATALGQHLAAQVGQLQLPAQMAGCQACVTLAPQNRFQHFSDYHFQVWQAHHLRVTSASRWVDPADPVAVYSRRNAMGKANDVIVHRWSNDNTATIVSTLTPFYCVCCNQVSFHSR